jgi:hypothetical protein
MGYLQPKNRDTRSRWNLAAPPALLVATFIWMPHFAMARQSGNAQEPAKTQTPTANAPTVAPATANEAARQGERKEMENGTNIAAGMQWFHDQRAYPNKLIPPGVRVKALQQKAKMAADSAARQTRLPGRAPAQPHGR